MAEEVALDFGCDLVVPSSAIVLALVRELELLLLILVEGVATGHVGELQNPTDATPTHPHFVLRYEIHVPQIVDELHLVKSDILVLLLNLDRLGQVEFYFRLLGDFLSWLELGPKLIDLLLVTEGVLLCSRVLSHRPTKVSRQHRGINLIDGLATLKSGYWH